MGGRGSSSGVSSGGSGAGNSDETGANGGFSSMKTVGSREVTSWVESHNEQAWTYALNPPDSITINDIRFDNITGESMRSVTSNRTTDYTVNYQASQQASNGEYPVVQVTVTETRRRVGGRDMKVYNINKGKTKLW